MNLIQRGENRSLGGGKPEPERREQELVGRKTEPERREQEFEGRDQA